MLYKDYGGIDFFKNKSISLLTNCINNSLEKKTEIPKLIIKIVNDLSEKMTGKKIYNLKKSHNKMRSSKDILSDYGLKEGDY